MAVALGGERRSTRGASSKTTLVLLVAMLLASGACALVYQQLWLRLLSLVFGVTIYAAATVLATFFAGLALGSYLAGRFADRTDRPLWWYGLAEALIGVIALATPALFDAVGGLYEGLHGVVGDSVPVLTLVRVVLSFLMLIAPATLMGATLPLAVRAATTRGSAMSQRVGLLYATNTSGAVVGTLAAGSWLLGSVGLSLSFQIGAALNLAVGVASVLWSRRTEPVLEPAPEEADVPEPATVARHGEDPEPVVRSGAISARTRRAVLAVSALSGFAGLALEIVWFRVLVLHVNATNHAFGVMLATVLVGIAIGSYVVTPVIRRRANWLLILVVLEMALALVAVCSLFLLTQAYGVVPGQSTGGSWRFVVVASTLVAFPATLLMGVAFPIGVKLWAEGSDPDRHVGTSDLGTYYAVNTMGGIAGSLVAGFLLVPELGTRTSIIVVAALLLVGGLVLASCLPQTAPRLVTAGAGGLAFVLAAVVAVPDPYTTALEHRYPGEHVIWEEEGVQTTVTIHENDAGVRIMYLDGLHQANSTPELVQFHRLIGALPAAVHPDPKRGLVVGLGGGATPGALAETGVDVEVVELSREVVRAARFFEDENYGAVDHPRVRFRIDDGRNHLLLSGERYDIITADPIVPSTAGAGKLWSKEYWELARDALAPNGVMLQWIGDSREREWRMITRTFREVFPEATLWAQGRLLVGSRNPIHLDQASFECRLREPRVRQAFADAGIPTFDALVALYTAGPSELRAFVGDGPTLTDNQPRLEYYRPRPDEPDIDIAPVVTPAPPGLVRATSSRPGSGFGAPAPSSCPT